MNTCSPRRMRVERITRIGILAAIATLLMFILELPLPLLPPFLKLDFSFVPAVIAGFAFGPVAGVSVLFIKDALHLLVSSSMGIGELADFLVGIALVLPSALIYQKGKTLKSALLGYGVGFVCMNLMGLASNWWITLPFYMNMWSLDAIVGQAAEKNAAITSLQTVLFYGILPFNLVKGSVIGVLSFGLYKRLVPLLRPKCGNQSAGRGQKA